MTPLTTVPTLDQVAGDPTCLRGLSRGALVDLALRALTVHAAVTTAALAAPAETTTGDDRLITTKELARRMAVSPAFVYDHRDEWPFTIKRPGMRPMFSLRGFEAWVAQQDGRQGARQMRRGA